MVDFHGLNSEINHWGTDDYMIKIFNKYINDDYIIRSNCLDCLDWTNAV